MRREREGWRKGEGNDKRGVRERKMTKGEGRKKRQ